MFDRFKRFLSSSPPRTAFRDPALGQLAWSEDEDAWVAPVPHHPDVRFLISGDQQPDSRLLAHAQDIAADFPAFERAVRSALEAETAKFNPFYSEEIRSLTLESVYLCWPKRPHDGMLYLSGNQTERVWRFDYVNRRPAGLGFDS